MRIPPRYVFWMLFYAKNMSRETKIEKHLRAYVEVDAKKDVLENT